MEGNGIPVGKEGAALRILLEQASHAAAGIPRDFVPALLGETAPEDLLRYAPEELASLAASAYAHLRDRTPGSPKIRIHHPESVRAGGRLQAVSVVEIVNDDMPFLLDSVMGELNERGVAVQLVAHPVFRVARDRSGRLAAWHSSAAEGGLRESFIHIHIDRVDDDLSKTIVDSLAGVLAEVRLCVADWKEMVTRVQATIDSLKAHASPLPKEEVGEAIAFLEWLAADNFTFLGCREYRYREEAGHEPLEPLYGTGLGILRGQDVHLLRKGGRHLTTTPQLRAFLREPRQLIITKANVRSRVHRRVHMDYVGVKRFDSAGRLVGEFRIAGLFTSTAYTRRAAVIPYLRRKVETVVARAGFDSAGHSGKALVNVLETFPRDDLFQIDEDTLYRFALEILQLEVRPRVRVLAWTEKFDRFVSALVFVPRERYDSAVRARIGAYLAEAFEGHVSAFYPTFLDGPLTRVHFIIGRDAGPTPRPERALLEQAVAEIALDWEDGLSAALLAAHAPGRARTLERRYGNAFPAGYRESFTPEEAVGDLRVLDTLSGGRPTAVQFFRREGAPPDEVRLKLFSHERSLPLSERVPLLENMGFAVIDERTFTTQTVGGEAPCFWLHDMRLRAMCGDVDLPARAGRLEGCLMAVLGGRAENDGYNALVLAAGLPWRDVALLRTLSRFLRQAGVPYSQDYLWTTMVRHASIAEQIIALFHARFDPRVAGSAEARAKHEAELAASIESAIGAVQSLDDDRILRRFLELVRAAVRTNFYQVGDDGQVRPTLSVKFASRHIEALPRPRPLYEIFVYSPRVEGVHLRFGKVARGGLRWSDRPQDFRTEVLALAKAQQVKNAVIVPVGAKGGFVPKQLPATGGREAVIAEGTACYELFVTSLLEITDNIGPDGIVPPPAVVRHDGDDPYLVVAADKGTATFSDLANGISERRGFWLDDAFASGGSRGYDHKQMGITARGAWEAVKRHFREMEVDIASMPFTVAGIGDMSGDVFGNGMLLEKTIRLVAAFDHRDIFLDPDPDPTRSFAERERLFRLPRSSWQDYDKKVLSRGGGVYPRNAKSIPISPEAGELLGLDGVEATPAAVVQAILRLPVDLLWFGGIGTFVRASGESDEKVGDKGNDAIRIAAADLRCKVIGEGANLGVTQLGRIEAARNGVRLNTDAIDNSGGVNSSDVEVNLKIAMARPRADGRLSEDDRNALLRDLTDDVAALVLRNNRLQTLALSLAERRGAEDIGLAQQTMHTLEDRGLLDRAVEFLPSDKELDERAARGQGLTRPELAVLLAYAKIALFGDLLTGDVPDDPYFAKELVRYFPRRVAERFPETLQSHRLRREIIATMLANSMINRGGPFLVARIAGVTGAPPTAIANAFAVVRDCYRMTDLNETIERLDGRVPARLQLDSCAAVQDLLLDRIDWFLRNVDLSPGVAGTVEHYRDGIDAVEAALAHWLPVEHHAALSARTADLISAGVPEPLARKLASIPELAAATDIVRVSDRAHGPIDQVTGVYFRLRQELDLDRLIEAARTVRPGDHFERLALDRARSDLGTSLSELAAEVLAHGKDADAAMDGWMAQRGQDVQRTKANFDAIVESGLTLAKLVVAASQLSDLPQRTKDSVRK